MSISRTQFDLLKHGLAYKAQYLNAGVQVVSTNMTLNFMQLDFSLHNDVTHAL